jgi:3-oxoacyl-[acyl-carrier protein] reductase
MSRSIVVTGASSEIGLAICEALLRETDRAIVQCYAHQERCRPFQEKFGAACRIAPADFAHEGELEAFCKQLDEVDILVNAAAVTETDLLVNLSDDQITRMIRVNILAAIKICQAVLPAMVARRSGVIVNLSSVAARRGNRGQSVYAGTKGFLESFTRSLAAEYGKRNIRVNCVAPGPIQAGSLKTLLKYAPDEAAQSIVAPTLGHPQDVGAAVAFLCSPEARFINGVCLPVDGGFCRGV